MIIVTPILSKLANHTSSYMPQTRLKRCVDSRDRSTDRVIELLNTASCRPLHAINLASCDQHFQDLQNKAYWEASTRGFDGIALCKSRLCYFSSAQIIDHNADALHVHVFIHLSVIGSAKMGGKINFKTAVIQTERRWLVNAVRVALIKYIKLRREVQNHRVAQTFSQCQHESLRFNRGQ